MVGMGFINQEHPRRLENALLMGVCPESNDKTLRYQPFWLHNWRSYIESPPLALL